MAIKEKKKTKHLLSYLFLALLMGGTAYFIFKDTSISSLAEAFKHVNPWYIAAGLSMMLVFLACEATNITMILKSLGQKVHFFSCLGFSFIGFYFSSITPSASGGQPAQVYYMNKRKINMSYSSLALLIIIVVYQAVTLLYAAAMFFIEYDCVIKNISGIKLILIYGAVANLVIVVSVCAVIFSKKLVRKLVIFATKLLAKIRIIKDVDRARAGIENHIVEYTRGADHIKKNPTLILKVTCMTVVQVTALFLIPFFVSKAFSIEGRSMMEMLALQSLLTISVDSLPLPGALGASESAFINIFKMFFGTSLLVPAMLLSRGISFYSFLLITGVVTIIIHVKSRRKVVITPVLLKKSA